MTTVVVYPENLSYSTQGLWVFLNELRLMGNPNGKPDENASWVDRVSWFELDRNTCKVDTHFTVKLCGVLDRMDVGVVLKDRTLFILPIELHGISIQHPSESMDSYMARVSVQVVNKMFGEVVNEITNQKWVDPDKKFDAWAEPIILLPIDLPLDKEELDKAVLYLTQNNEPTQRLPLDRSYRAFPDVLFRTYLRGNTFVMSMEVAHQEDGHWDFLLPMKITERSEYSKDRSIAIRMAQEAWTRMLKINQIKALKGEIQELHNTIDAVMRSGEDTAMSTLVSKAYPL